MIYILFATCYIILIVFNIIILRYVRESEISKEDIKNILKLLKENQNRNESLIKSEFSLNRKEQLNQAQLLRQEIANNVERYSSSITTSFQDLSRIQQENFRSFEERFVRMSNDHLKSQKELRQVVELGLKNVQEDNKSQLEKMRATVDEKLQGTLERRLSESFGQVSDKLKQVYEGLGEMKNLAHGVGDLKKMLTNVKARGTWGEFQLGNILEQFLSPQQYEKNVSIKKGSKEIVEFAIKLPGQNKDEFVYLPVDSKFPQEDYQKLITTQNISESEISKLTSSLKATVKKEARTIRDKYISPPKTTDFAIMFLPTEGLYAEILRQPGLADDLQREYRVMVAGPTNLAALLNSLSVGFRTLAIQKRSSDVWKLLGAIKTQFGTFSGLLDNVQKKLNDASDVMEKASKKSKTIEKRLIKVEELPIEDARMLMSENDENNESSIS